MNRKSGFVFLSFLLCCALGVSVASAQIAGFKISEPVLSNQTTLGADADFDVIAYGSSTAPLPGLRAGTPLDNSSSNVFTQTYSFGNGPRPYQVRLAVNSDWNTSGLPALSFGDGSTQQTMVLALETSGMLETPGLVAAATGEGVGMTTFRGSFSHTYPNGNFNLKARLTPVGTYGSPTPGVQANVPLTEGQAYMGTLVNNFVYQATVSPLSPPGMNTYTFQTTQPVTNTFPNTVVEATATETVAINAAPPTLTVDGGLCPGMLNINITDGTPGARVTFWASNTAGSTPIGMGPCAATVVDLDTSGPRRTSTFDGSGNFSFSRFFTPNQCNIMMQAVNHGNCAKSMIEMPPMPPPPPPPTKPSAAAASTTRSGLGSGS